MESKNKYKRTYLLNRFIDLENELMVTSGEGIDWCRGGINWEFEIDINITFAVQRLDKTFEAFINLGNGEFYNTRNFLIEDNFVTFIFDWSKVNN